MADFEIAIEITLKHEGGYVNDSSDSGGRTKYGISQRQYPDLDIRNLTVNDAKAIYRQDYWNKLRLDEINDQAAAGKIFDFGINAGNKRSVVTAQQACNISNVFNSKLIEDGIIGPRTISAINSIKYTGLFVKLFIKIRMDYYISLALRKPVLKKFLIGWLFRA